MAYNKVTGANGKQSSGYFNVTNSNGFACNDFIYSTILFISIIVPLF